MGAHVVGEPVHDALTVLIKRPRIGVLEQFRIRIVEFPEKRSRCARIFGRKVLVIRNEEFAERSFPFAPLLIKIRAAHTLSGLPCRLDGETRFRLMRALPRGLRAHAVLGSSSGHVCFNKSC